MVRSRAWVGILIIVPFAILALLSVPLSEKESWGEFQFETVGWLIFLAGAAIRWWATLYIGGRKTKTIVSEGPYSICRNPLYVGTFLLGMASAIFLQSFTFALGFVVAAVYYLMVTVPAEEMQLREIFGVQFDRYCERVPRFWPRFSTFQTSPTIDVQVRGLMAEMWRTSRWLWIPVLAEMLEHLRAEPWWPRLFHLP
jgi:protein-S-isoprenylcysteine O-methyltransferase Ste14